MNAPGGTPATVDAGSAAYRRVVVAMTAAGIATFSQLYAVQAVLPAVAATFDAPAAHAALTVSFATGALAVSVLVWSGLADRFGRVPVMTAALAASSVLGLIAPHAEQLWVLIALRALQGAALGGVPAVAMAYLAERVVPERLGRAAGAYVAGTSIGGMSGRLVAGAVADAGGWRTGVGADAALGVLALAVFVVLIPRDSGRARPAGGSGTTGDAADAGDGLAPDRLVHRIGAQLREPGMLALYAQAFLLMGAFVTVYNYLGFRLTGPPFDVSQTVVAFLFVAYLAGTVGSATVGRIGERLGRRPVLLLTTGGIVLGTVLLLSPALPVISAGLVVLTFCFFAAHATAAGWVGLRARTGRAQAAALYTLAYYLGSSLFGWLGGLVYDGLGWHGVVGYVVALCLTAALTTHPLRRE
ncbi:YNFM family putative membrane transporter [Haloactinopolyspora alba]|uniref:YNFM family putative membrane transporter n=1 Tax=Haloactinopolyspora alba TaxID=648780 RepID=A0A2P8DVC9_9ACTN|nr:MFS transporter [Haloactinopolyspora alba]PSL01169.1 YNFM family putative membrane transporter [Haloactinopolyspora alba]